MGSDTVRKINQYVREWERRCYKNGIPDEAPIELKDKVPSYKSICLALLNNDLNLKSLGFEPKTSKYYSMLKRIEIEARDYNGKQLKLKL